MKNTLPSVIQKAVLIAFLGGAFELIMDVLGHSLTGPQARMLLAAGFGALVVWVLDDVSRTLQSILEELRKR
jgi:hypothetical protein